MDIARPVPGVGHDYVKGLSETVNPANGSLGIKIDLPVPATRGLSLPFALIYNSGIVHHTVVETSNGGQNVGLVMDGIQFKPTDRSINGWSDTIPYASASSWAIDSPPQANQQAWCDVTASYTLYDPNGESHGLGITAISPVQGGGTQIGSNWCTTIGYSSNGFFAANGYWGKITGGTCAGLPSTGNAPGCDSAAPSFTATDINNTVYTFPSGYVSVGYNGSGLNPMIFPTTIEDRNGNIVQIASSHSSIGYIPIANSITDNAGRAIVSVAYQGGTNIPSSYTVGGLTYTLGYTTTSASYTAPSSQIPPLPPNGNITCNANFGVNSSGKTAIQTIVLPNNQKYTFQYDPTYGLIDEIDYPNGGWVKYTWKLNDTLSDFVTIPGSTTGPPAFGFCNFEYKTPAIWTRTVGYTPGGSAALTQTFTYSTTWNNTPNPAQWTSKTTTVVTTDNVTGKTSKKVYQYASSTVPTWSYAQNVFPPQIPVEQSVATYDWGPSAAAILTVNKTWADPYAMTSETHLLPSNKSFMTQYDPDGSDRVTEKREFDFSQSLYRKTDYTYYAASPSVSSPCKEVVYDATNHPIAETDAYYDGGTTTCASGNGATASVTGLPVFPDGTPTHDEVKYGPAVAVFRGNVTKLVRWSNNGPSPTTTYTYDETGQRISMTDACGNTACSDVTGTGHTTTYLYTDVPAGGNPAGNSNAYLTKIMKSAVNGITQHEDFSYYYDLGSLASSSDVNSNTTNYTYYGESNLNRLQQVQGPLDPNNGNARPTTNYSYDDSVPSTTTTVTMSAGSTKSTTATMDGLGHVVKTDRADSNTYGDDIVLSTYDGTGHLYTVTNPNRSSSDPSLPQGSTKYAYDALGRMTIQTNQDKSTQIWCRDGFTSTGQTNCPGQLSSIANSSWTDFYDETGRHWQRVSDAEGRLIAVMEPEATTTPTLETDYNYDGQDNLIKVDQWGGPNPSTGDRVRTFVYDSLSRLTNACNPESIASGSACTTPAAGTFGPNAAGSWSDIYTYDANSNLQSRLDARGVSTTYSYDVLNRISQKSYTNDPQNTAAVAYFYDLATQGWGWGSGSDPQTNLIGRLSGISVSSPNAWIVYGYDSMGRVTIKSECLPRDCGNNHHDLRYQYDLAGDMTFYDRGTDFDRNTNSPNQGYYFGGFNMTYDTAGNIKTVTADTTDANHPASILSNTVYTPLGGLFTANMVGIYLQTRTYSNRGWYTGISVIDSASQPIWSTSTGYAKNGSVSSSTDTWNGSWSYLYGNTNRLAQAIGPSFTLAYTYDHWGNRTSQNITAGSGGAPQWSQSYNSTANNNRFLTGATYDNAGNITNDGFHAYTYDAESRIHSVDGTIVYAYDGENNRVAQLSNTGTVQKEYLYDFQGRLMTEVGLDYKAARANIYVGSELFAEDAPDPYRTSTSTATLLRIGDQLGTLRARWDIGANWVGACSSLPYGDNTICTAGADFGPPVNDMLFTGKQRDQESDLDYFGARYYNSTRGRFMSPDWSDNQEPIPYADLENPQTLNLYAYVQNDPLSHRDSTGHDCDSSVVSHNEYGDIVVSARPCHFDWSVLTSSVVGIGHHYIPRAVWQNIDRTSDAYRVLDRATTGALKNGHLSNRYDYLHRALNRSTDKVLRDLERDLGKSVEDFNRGDFEQLGQRLESAGGDIEAFNERLAGLEPQARGFADALSDALAEVFGPAEGAAGATLELGAAAGEVAAEIPK